MKSRFEVLQVRTSIYRFWGGYKSTHNTRLGTNEPKENKRGWKGTESHFADESGAQGGEVNCPRVRAKKQLPR